MAENKESRFKRFGPIALIIGFALLALLRFGLRTGFQFGPTNIEVLASYAPRFEAMHDAIVKSVRHIDQVSEVESFSVSKDLVPQPVLIVGDKDGSNASLTSLIYLKSYQQRDLMGSTRITPEVLEKQRFSISEDDDFEHILAWTGDDNPLSQSVYNNDGSRMEARLKWALTLEYLFIGRSRKIPPLHEYGTARPKNELECEIFLIRLSDGEIVGQAPLILPPEANPGGGMGPDEIEAEVIRQLSAKWSDVATIQSFVER